MSASTGLAAANTSCASRTIRDRAGRSIEMRVTVLVGDSVGGLFEACRLSQLWVYLVKASVWLSVGRHSAPLVERLTRSWIAGGCRCCH